MRMEKKKQDKMIAEAFLCGVQAFARGVNCIWLDEEFKKIWLTLDHKMQMTLGKSWMRGWTTTNLLKQDWE
jgi:hypothetical protein